MKYITPGNLRTQVSWLLWQPEMCSSVVMMSGVCFFFFLGVCEKGGGKPTFNKKMWLIGEKEISEREGNYLLWVTGRTRIYNNLTE